MSVPFLFSSALQNPPSNVRNVVVEICWHSLWGVGSRAASWAGGLRRLHSLPVAQSLAPLTGTQPRKEGEDDQGLASGQGSDSGGSRLPLFSMPFDIRLPSPSKPAFRRDPQSHIYALRAPVSQRVFPYIEKGKRCFTQMSLGNPKLKNGYFLEDFFKKNFLS